MVAIMVGIGIVLALGVTLAISSTATSDHPEEQSAASKKVRNIVVNIEEKLGVSESQSP